MEFYEAIQKRRTVRDFSTIPVPEDILMRILDAGMKAPSHDHARDWHFVVLHDPEHIAEVLKQVNHGANVQTDIINHWDTATECQKNMYYDALPKQVKMLSQSQCLILPFFRAGAELARVRALFNAGRSIPARIAMMAITMRSSISVKTLLFMRYLR